MNVPTSSIPVAPIVSVVSSLTPENFVSFLVSASRAGFNVYVDGKVLNAINHYLRLFGIDFEKVTGDISPPYILLRGRGAVITVEVNDGNNIVTKNISLNRLIAVFEKTKNRKTKKDYYYKLHIPKEMVEDDVPGLLKEKNNRDR